MAEEDIRQAAVNLIVATRKIEQEKHSIMRFLIDCDPGLIPEDDGSLTIKVRIEPIPAEGY